MELEYTRVVGLHWKSHRNLIQVFVVPTEILILYSCFLSCCIILRNVFPPDLCSTVTCRSPPYCALSGVVFHQEGMDEPYCLSTCRGTVGSQSFLSGTRPFVA